MSLTKVVAKIDSVLFKDRVDHYPNAVYFEVPTHFVEIPKGHRIFAVDLGPPAGVGPHMVGLLHTDAAMNVQRLGVVAEGWSGRPEFVTWVGGPEDADEIIRLGKAALDRYASGGKALFGGPVVEFNEQAIDPTWLEEQGVA